VSGLRYAVKKAARAAFGVAGPLFVDRRQVTQLRVLTYHRFGSIPGDVFCIEAADFERQVRYLADTGRAINLDRALEHFQQGQALPEGAILLTIDDGHRSTWDIARPILEEHGVPAVAYITSALVGGDDQGGTMPEAYMTWDEVAALEELDIAIGSHATNHRSVGLLSPSEAFEEVDRSRRELIERTGAAVRSFAYPFGTRVDCPSFAAEAVDRAGYDCAFTSRHGTIRQGLDPFQLPRIKIEAGEGDWHFRRTCRGAMDPWSVVDDGMWRLQQNRSETIAEDGPPNSA